MFTFFQAALTWTKWFRKVFFSTRSHCLTPGALLIARKQLATPDSKYIADIYVDIPVKSTHSHTYTLVLLIYRF